MSPPVIERLLSENRYHDFGSTLILTNLTK